MRAYGVKDMQKGLEMVRAIVTDGYTPAVVRLHALLMLIVDGPSAIAKASGRVLCQGIWSCGYW